MLTVVTITQFDAYRGTNNKQQKASMEKNKNVNHIVH